jgi:hypothetical protein
VINPFAPVTALMKSSTWLFPIVETVHILGFIVVIGTVLVFDLRVLGLNRGIPVRQLARLTLPWSAVAFLFVVPSGVLLFAAQPAEMLANRLFAIKLGLVFLAACNAAFFHTGPYQSVATWDRDAVAPAAARISAAVSIMLWVSVVVCGRFLAYI